MRKIFLKVLALGLLSLPTPAMPQSAGVPKSIFKCSLGVKSVTVTAVGGNFIYKFGSPGKDELSIVGSKKNGNLFYTGRFATLDYVLSLRFTNGRYSYALSEEGISSDFNAGRHGNAALIVLRDDKIIGRKFCKRGNGFDSLDLLSSVPEDMLEY